MNNINDFIDYLASIPLVNQNSTNLYAIEGELSMVRRHNLKVYLRKMQAAKPKILIIGEAAGYNGCRLTGIPFTSEFILKESHANGLGDPSDYRFCSSTKPQKELSATFVWRELKKHDAKPLIWNIFPFHPSLSPDRPKTNRPPTKDELAIGFGVLKKLLEIFPDIATIGAIGCKAYDTISNSDIKNRINNIVYIRHPANSGSNKFTEGLSELMKNYTILAINPGSTSTKIAVYTGSELVGEFTLRHTIEDLNPYPDIISQFDFRRKIILEALAAAGIEISRIDAVIGRGGLLRPISSGVYVVNEAMKQDMQLALRGNHASNLGGLIAWDIASSVGAKAFIADPVVVDELLPVARLSGLAQLDRISIFHALNQKAVARSYAETIGSDYQQMNIIVAHLGGGISVGAHCNGQVVDVNNALDGDGPFSSERAGTLPAGQLVDLCFGGEYTKSQIKKMLCGGGGLVSHLGVNDLRDAQAMIAAGDDHARLVVDAMCYNIAKAIGSMAVVLGGRVDAVILTGGMAHSDYVCQYIENRTRFIAPIVVMAGENEMAALASNALSVLQGKVVAKVY